MSTFTNDSQNVDKCQGDIHTVYKYVTLLKILCNLDAYIPANIL